MKLTFGKILNSAQCDNHCLDLNASRDCADREPELCHSLTFHNPLQNLPTAVLRNPNANVVKEHIFSVKLVQFEGVGNPFKALKSSCLLTIRQCRTPEKNKT